MRYCILGGGGSFGLHTAGYLLEQSDTELVLSVGRAKPKPRCFTLGVGEGDKRYSYHRLHVTYDITSLLMLLAKHEPHVVINFAAQGESGTSFSQTWRYFETNCVGLSRLIENLHVVPWLKRFVHISSSEVYGSTDWRATEATPLKPTSPYAISKAAFDQYLTLMVERFRFPAVILRPSNCYGEGQQLHRIVPKAFLFGLTGRKLPLHGGGVAEKSFMHSWDLAHAIHLAANMHPQQIVYNVGPGDPVSIREICRMVAQALGMNDVSSLCEVTNDRQHQDSRYWISSAPFEALTGWRPEVGWALGLTAMRGWVEQHLDALRVLPTEFVMRP